MKEETVIAHQRPKLERHKAMRDLLAEARARGDDAVELDDRFIIVETDHGKRPDSADQDLKTRRRELLSTSQASPPRGSGQYTIQYKYLSSMTAAMRASFEYASARWGKMITTKLPSLSLGNARCRPVPSEVLPSQIPELFIYVNITAIDGAGKTLGQAGPCIVDGNGYPRVGYIEFDVADVTQMISQQTFDAVCVHEIAHIIGFGTLWPEKNLVGGTYADPRYMGKNGVAALPTIKGSFMGTPAIQDTGGEGTYGSHWRDTAFGDEMMTAYLSASYQPVSALTVESFRDLGYSVDSSAYDAFNVSATGYPPPSNVPYNENPSNSPNWYNWDQTDSFWTATTIWIIAVAGAAFLVIFLSCCYVKMCKTKKYTVPPPSASNASTTRTRRTPTPWSSRPTHAPPPPPVAQPAYVPARSPYENIPVAQPVMGNPSSTNFLVPDQDLGMFMEITGCQDRLLALRYMREANNNVSLAVDRYLHSDGRQLAAV